MRGTNRSIWSSSYLSKQKSYGWKTVFQCCFQTQKMLRLSWSGKLSHNQTLPALISHNNKLSFEYLTLKISRLPEPGHRFEKKVWNFFFGKSWITFYPIFDYNIFIGSEKSPSFSAPGSEVFSSPVNIPRMGKNSKVAALADSHKNYFTVKPAEDCFTEFFQSGDHFLWRKG